MILAGPGCLVKGRGADWSARDFPAVDLRITTWPGAGGARRSRARSPYTAAPSISRSAAEFPVQALDGAHGADACPSGREAEGRKTSTRSPAFFWLSATALYILRQSFRNVCLLFSWIRKTSKTYSVWGGAPMAIVNGVSPRDEVEAAKARVAVRRSQSDASGESDAVVDVPFTLPAPLIPSGPKGRPARPDTTPASRRRRRKGMGTRDIWAAAASGRSSARNWSRSMFAAPT